MTLCGEDRDIAAMNNELNHLYQRIHASPAITADLPENLGTGTTDIPLDLFREWNIT